MVLLDKSWVSSALSCIRHDFCDLTQQVNSILRGPDILREERSGILFIKCVLSTKLQNHLEQIPRPFPRSNKSGEKPKSLSSPQKYWPRLRKYQ